METGYWEDHLNRLVAALMGDALTRVARKVISRMCSKELGHNDHGSPWSGATGGMKRICKGGYL